MNWIGTDRTLFFQLWTKKEALLKAAGKGRYNDPINYNVLEGSAIIEGYKFKVNVIPFHDVTYMVACAINCTDTEYEITKINLLELPGMN